MRKVLGLGAVLACALISGIAHADTIYNLTLSSTTGNAGSGIGSIDLNIPPTTGLNSVSTYISTNKSGDILKGLSFSIGGDTFNLSNAAANYGLVQFISGNLFDITYQGSTTTATAILNFSANGLSYNFSDSAKQEMATGTISAALAAPAAVSPEPSSMALLGTGLAAGFAALRRRRLA